MLTIFRRHTKDCKFTGRKHRNCQCPIAVEGMLHGRMIRKSLDLRGWEAAQKLVREWEANPGGAAVTVETASEKFIADAIFRNMSEGMVRKLRNVAKEITAAFGPVSLRSVTIDDIREVMKKWKLAPVTKQKRVEMLRSFFNFCENSGWIDKNPARGIRVKVKHKPTLPFTEEQMEKILWAADTVREIHYQMNEGIEKKMRALILLMRHSGLRISDAVTLTRDRIKNGKLFLYQAKTDEPVWMPLPEIVLTALDGIAEPGRPYYFWTGNGKLRHAPTEWQARLKRVFVIAGVYDPASHNQSHRLRDTFAVGLLEKGVSIETVSMLLGHQNITVTQKHYNPWVKARQLKLEEAIKAAYG